MHIDLQTLKELELLNFDTGGKNIFEMLDQTETPGGQYRFKQNFRKPPDDLKEIIETQTAVKYIINDIRNWELPVDAKLMDLLDVYYFSKSKPLIGRNFISRFLENISYRFIYKDFKATFIRGTRYAVQFLKQVNEFNHKTEKKNLPELLSKIFSHITEIIEIKDFTEAINVGHVLNISVGKLLKLDQAFRDNFKEDFLQLIDLVYQLDVLISKARATIKYKLNFPVFSEVENSSFRVEGLFHLFVHEPVVNSIGIEPSQNFIFLTGPNMAGKTTFLKACGVSVFLAHLGMGVPAEKMELSLFDRIFTSLNVSDNLPKGYSYFYSEVKRVKEAAMAFRESKRSFVIFDELFKGTNVKDAFDGSFLIIQELVKWKSCFFILSSHILELGKEIEKFPQVRFMCFDSKVENGKPYFNFKIKEGLSDERLGLIILKDQKVFDLLDPEKPLN
ncbi:MAG: hypothetical protein U0W24_06985 [Bacteroidales bacterium]